jgi:2-dehydro-3-deoxygluconokinase
MAGQASDIDILADDLSAFDGGPAFVTFGEVMVRDTPADSERLERARQVWLSLAGSEFTLAIMLARLGIPSAFITRVPDNPYGWMLRNVAREQGVDADHFAWADAKEPIGRFLYELGRTPRPGKGWYQRRYSAASRLGPGMIDWRAALARAGIFHASGITFGLSAHSGYERNYLQEAFVEALGARPEGCLVGMDFNYRSTLWNPDLCRGVMTPIITDHIDVLITTIEDMAKVYGLSVGNRDTSAIVRGELGEIADGDLQALMKEIVQLFSLQAVAITIRHPDSHEQHRWESAALDAEGHFYRSPSVHAIVLRDRLGGGDTWNAGFYYGLLTETDPALAIRKGVLVGDAATRLKQTLMYDLPIVTRAEVQALLRADESGGGRRTVR